MNKRLASQHAQTGRAALPAGPKGTGPAASTQQPAGELAAPEKTPKAGVNGVVIDVQELQPNERNLVNRLLKEGSTFEDVVESVDARGGQCITLNAVQTYFQENQKLQGERARRQIEDAEALLASIDKDPKSAEARLARAAFLTGYARVRRNASVVTPRDAARYRIECENLSLKHQILVMHRRKAQQELDYSRARTSLIEMTQRKMRVELLDLEREVTAHKPGQPLGSDIVQKIQQLYGLACQPLIYVETADAAQKAHQLAK